MYRVPHAKSAIILKMYLFGEKKNEKLKKEIIVKLEKRKSH